jgi:hypothetical protein
MDGRGHLTCFIKGDYTSDIKNVPMGFNRGEGFE